MAISLVNTVGAATANTYVDLTAAQAFIDGLVENDDVTAWASSTTDQKNRALFSAAQRIDRERFWVQEQMTNRHWNGQGQA